ncbi:hypothetical protein AB0M20_43185, partial [Actinoplanes sp. NPDC051633]|uniref:hypothetical protein n=1 Tax=Actinoplanes sp. NPDC051633 TaxID=3155670 RepID=UPI00341F326B
MTDTRTAFTMPSYGRIAATTWLRMAAMPAPSRVGLSAAGAAALWPGRQPCRPSRKPGIERP